MTRIYNTDFFKLDTPPINDYQWLICHNMQSCFHACALQNLLYLTHDWCVQAVLGMA